MAAYVIVDVDVHDPALYEEYKKASTQSAARHGATFLVRGGAVEVLEGTWRPKRLVILEFESAEAARAWYHSEDYREAMAVRKRAATGTLVLVEGA